MKVGLWVLCFAVCMLAVPPVAATETRGSVQVNLEIGDLPAINGAVTLYQVGTKAEHGYQITEEFGGGMVAQEEVTSDKLAMWLAESADERGATLLLDADGNAVFSDLEEGLYLLVQTERIDGFYPINPILLTVPDENCPDVKIRREPVPVITELPKTGQSPLPFLGILGMILSSAGLLICAGKEKKP